VKWRLLATLAETLTPSVPDRLQTRRTALILEKDQLPGGYTGRIGLGSVRMRESNRQHLGAMVYVGGRSFGEPR